MKAERVRGNLDLILLAALRHAPAHGYAVITALRERTDGLLDLTEGSVYPALHRLEDRGLLTSEWEPIAGRRRRVYRLTNAGAGALTVEHRDWAAMVSAVSSLLGAAPAPRAAS